MDFILMGENLPLRRINISKAGQDLGRRWHNPDLAVPGVGTGGESQPMDQGGIFSALVTLLVLPTGFTTTKFRLLKIFLYKI